MKILTERFTIRLSPQMLKELSIAANDLHLKRSMVIIQAIREFLANRKKGK